DQGGGLQSATIQRVDTGTVVAAWNAGLAESTRPGPIQHDLASCLGSPSRAHGTTEYIATVVDVAGRARVHRFWLRADHHGPSIGGGPDDNARIATGQPELAFVVDDDGSGLDRVDVSIDGHPV